jgi:hypothetical protein
MTEYTEGQKRALTALEYHVIDDGPTGIGFYGSDAKMILDIMTALEQRPKDLLAKARALVELLDDAEVNHGGLIGGVTLRAKNELRLELSRWK